MPEDGTLNSCGFSEMYFWFDDWNIFIFSQNSVYESSKLCKYAKQLLPQLRFCGAGWMLGLISLINTLFQNCTDNPTFHQNNAWWKQTSVCACLCVVCLYLVFAAVGGNRWEPALKMLCLLKVMCKLSDMDLFSLPLIQQQYIRVHCPMCAEAAPIWLTDKMPHCTSADEATKVVLLSVEHHWWCISH